MSRRPKEQLGIADAADYLYAIHGEFKPADEAAADCIREARTLLDVSIRLTFNAFERNAIVARRKAEAEARERAAAKRHR